jgi:hypothetical protein
MTTSMPAPPPRGVDGRTALARRYKRLVTAFTRDLGDDLTEADRALVASAAMAALRIESLRAQVLSGAVVDDDQLTRLLNSTTRILTTISGRTRKARKQKLSIADYLKDGAS